MTVCTDCGVNKVEPEDELCKECLDRLDISAPASAVYVLLEEFPFEGCTILGIYSTRELADAARNEAIKKDVSRGYNEFNIEDHKVNDEARG